MANEIMKEIKTRIALRTGDYAYWTTGAGKDIELLKGEVCVCTVAIGDNQAQTAPTVLLKICDVTGKKFGDLKWTSALAADVYEWAKAANVVFENEHILFKNATGGTIKDLDLSTFATNGDVEEVGRDLALLEGLVHASNESLNTTAQTVFGGINEVLEKLGDVETLQTQNTDSVVDGVNEVIGNIGSLSGLNTTNKDSLVAAINETLQAVEVGGTGSVITVTKATAPTAGSEATYVVNQGGKPVDVKIEIPKHATSADYGVLGVTAGNDTITVGGTAQNPTIAVAANKFDAYGAAAAVQDNLTAYENTHASDYTNTKIDELVQGAKDYADNNDANTEYHVEYDSTNKKIKLVAGADASKMEIDATAFIKDGMIDTVTIGEDNDLVITFNTAAGKDEIRLPLDQLVDIYTGSNGSEVNIAVSNQNVISASLTNEVATKIGHGEEAYGWGNHANAGYAKEADLGDLAVKDKIVEGDIDGTIAVGKISGLEAAVKAVKVDNATDADHADNADTADYATEAGDAEKLGGQLPSYYATKSSVDAIPDTIDEKIAAYNTSKNFGDIITHNAAEFATSAQGGKADSALQEVTTTANGGLKITNKNQIDIDTDIVFVLDCNW